MVDKTKRLLLVNFLSVSSLSVLASPVKYANQRLSKNVLVEEFIYVYKFWKSFTEEEPVVYLKSRGVSNEISYSSIRNLSVDDFRRGNTLEIKGFVLSKIEVSVIASIGGQYLNS